MELQNPGRVFELDGHVLGLHVILSVHAFAQQVEALEAISSCCQGHCAETAVLRLWRLT